MGPSAQCRNPLYKLIEELNSWDSVDVKNGKTLKDWTTDTRDTFQVLKRVLVRIAAFRYRSRY